MRFFTFAPVLALATFAVAAPLAQGPVNGGVFLSASLHVEAAAPSLAVVVPAEPQDDAPIDDAPDAAAPSPQVEPSPSAGRYSAAPYSAAPSPPAPSPPAAPYSAGPYSAAPSPPAPSPPAPSPPAPSPPAPSPPAPSPPAAPYSAGPYSAGPPPAAPSPTSRYPVENAPGKPQDKVPSKEDPKPTYNDKKTNQSPIDGILIGIGNILKNPGQIVTDIGHIIAGMPSTYQAKEDLTKLPGLNRLAECGIPAVDIQAIAPIFDHIKANLTTDGIQTIMSIISGTSAGSVVGQGPLALALSIVKEVTRGIKITDIDFPKIVHLITLVIEKQQCIIPHL